MSQFIHYVSPVLVHARILFCWSSDFQINRYADQISLTRCLGRADDLESKLMEFRGYYNHERVHSGIGGSTPCEAGGALTTGVVKLDNFRWQARCRGLYQLPAAA